MSQNPLVNRQRLTAHRERAARMQGDFFLHQEAIFEVQDRLSLVNRTFSDVAVVTGFAQQWATAFPSATIVSDEEFLDLRGQSFDLVIHAMALHWANDPVGQLIQCNRALRPDGLFMAVFLGDQTLHELRSSLAEAESRLTDGLSPRVLPLGELRELGGLLQRASFALPVADKTTLRATYATLTDLMHDLRKNGETAAMTAQARPLTRDMLSLTEAIYRENYPQDDRLRATFDLLCLTGWAPDANQPKPLMPGSAKTRLADALGTAEFKLPEKE